MQCATHIRGPRTDATRSHSAHPAAVKENAARNYFTRFLANIETEENHKPEAAGQPKKKRFETRISV